MDVIVTGASSGIGFETAKILAIKEKCRVFAIARRIEALNKLKDICLEQYSQAEIIPLAFDLSKTDHLPHLVEILLQFKPEIRFLLNNAGALIHKPFEGITSGDYNQLFNINYFSPAELIRLLIPLMNPDKPCHIVNITSMGGFQGSAKFAGLSHYSASKAALGCLTECLAEEYKDSSIRFNALALGSVQTEMLGKAFSGYQANLTPIQAGSYISQFLLEGWQFYNGKVLPLTTGTP